MDMLSQPLRLPCGATLPNRLAKTAGEAAALAEEMGFPVVLKIVSARVIVTCPGRNFVTLKIETSDGLTGSATPP